MAKKRVILLVSNDCDACGEIVEEMADAIKRGGIKVVNVDTKTGGRLADREKVEEVPTLLSCNGKKCRRLA